MGIELGKPKIAVIVPICSYRWIHGLIDSINQNTEFPDYILIITNIHDLQTNHEILFPCQKYAVEIDMPQTILGVNASWNRGMEKIKNMDQKFDLISILNDDLILESHFFEKLRHCFRQSEKTVGVFCPETIEWKSQLQENKEVSVSTMRRREGWAFTMTHQLMLTLPAIPEELKTFCGDDWIWKWTYKIGMQWMKMNGNRVFHYVSGSVNTLSVQHDLRPEKELFSKICPF